MSGGDGDLLPRHEKILEASAIDSDVRSARGYRSVSVKAELRGFGFGVPQCRVPALLIPVRDVHGEIATYQIRPDEPRIKNGKAIKYETPGGSRMVLDVPPAARERVGDPSVPLFITEGAKKADSAVSIGLCCIALLGVWNWRGTNGLGGKTALPDWEVIALEKRDVFIVFDSDVMTKSAVHSALVRLKAFLESRKAIVHVIYLPSEEGGVKVGLDDYLAKGHACDDLLALATSELRQPNDASSRSQKYEVTEDGRTIYNKPEREGGASPVELANFSGRIVAEVVVNDGVETTAFLEILCAVGGCDRTVRVPVGAFPSMVWTANLGPRAIVAAGMGKKDQLREAIQLLSSEIAERVVYQHIGWIQTSDGHVYLHAAGGLGERGIVEGLEVELAGSLERFELPAPPQGKERLDAIKASLRVLDGLAPDDVVFPLFTFTWGVVVQPFRSAVHLAGITGGGKTELAALMQRHFGASMDAARLPGTWSSTANALEEQAFLTKDAILVIDDFKPGGSKWDVRELHQKADRVFRAQANQSGRGRLTREGALRPTRQPRGGVISTGEDVPGSQSCRARMLIEVVGAGDVDFTRLSPCQADALLYASAMAAFVTWLAPRLTQYHETRERAVEEERQVLIGLTAHARTATMGAEHLFSLRVLLEFAIDAGAIDEQKRATLDERGRVAIVKALERQAIFQGDADPSRVFLELVGAALQAGRAHLADRGDRDLPKTIDRQEDGATARVVGWRRSSSTSEPGGERVEWRPGGPCIGWIDAGAESIYLIPRAAYKAAQEMAQESPSRIDLSERQVWKQLAETGMLASCDGDRNTKTVRVAGRPTPTLHLRSTSLLPGTGTTGTTGTDCPSDAERGDAKPAGVPDTDTAKGNRPERNGNGGAAGAGSVPDVPVVHETGGEQDPPLGTGTDGFFEVSV